MSLPDRIDFEQFLDPSSELAPDVTFAVLDEDEKTVGKVEGHKIFLAMVSPVFRRSFFGAENKDKLSRMIEIKLTTLPAFKALMTMMYKRQPVAASLAGLLLPDVFEVGNLAERYMVPGLGGVGDIFFEENKSY